ncbi:response regulator [Occultella kanbiaonis]|uniref:response regulator n=1 Tax=Occultella kanbiaonis TaxID=2675754 RepID=UPI0012B7202A|nr:response regulator transcription factor [Occultella kanbiaonis]
MTIRVLLVDDDPLVVTGLRLMLGGSPSIDVVGEAADGDELTGAVARYRPDVVLLDVRMPRLDGVRALRDLRAKDPDPPAVIMLTTFHTDSVVLDALRSGATGFLLKHTAPEQIVTAIHAAAAGDATISPAVLGQLVRQASSRKDPEPAPDPLSSLTGREREVALAVSEGLSNGDIAERLHLSVGSVKSHISSALARLELDNRVQLAIAAHEARRRDAVRDGPDRAGPTN